ncbi:MAG TPA: MFS transporter [Pyrinomonadaceae bacterium]|nr:MFS transporter [Pyrinomonadaceae bacterium]
MQTQAASKDKVLNLLLHAVFFLSGIATVIIGQVLPHLAGRFQLDDLQLGYFFPAQFIGSITGTLMTNWLGRLGRLIPASAAGALLMAVGIAMLNLGSYELVLVAFLVNGLGIGLTLPAINVLTLERNPENSGSALNFLNFFWGLGAIVSKPLVDFTAQGTSLFNTTLCLSIPLLVLSIAIFLLPTPTEARVKKSEAGDDRTPIWSNPLSWAIALFAFIHVGFESGIGGWLTTYSDRVQGSATVHLITPTFLFFLFFIIGRAIAPAFFRYLDENKVIFISLLVILSGLALILTASESIQLGIGGALCGIGTSSVFPTNVSRFSKAFGHQAMRRATPLFLSGTLGATTITWLIGFLSQRLGDLRSGMYVLAVSILLLIVLQTALRFRESGRADVSKA